MSDSCHLTNRHNAAEFHQQSNKDIMSARILATPRPVVQHESDTNRNQPIFGECLSRPEDLQVSVEDEVRQLANSLWKQRGSPEGSPESDWFEAEKQLRKRACRFEAWLLRKRMQERPKLQRAETV